MFFNYSLLQVLYTYNSLYAYWPHGGREIWSSKLGSKVALIPILRFPNLTAKENETKGDEEGKKSRRGGGRTKEVRGATKSRRRKERKGGTKSEI